VAEKDQRMSTCLQKKSELRIINNIFRANHLQREHAFFIQSFLSSSSSAISKLLYTLHPFDHHHDLAVPIRRSSFLAVRWISSWLVQWMAVYLYIRYVVLNLLCLYLDLNHLVLKRPSRLRSMRKHAKLFLNGSRIL
jgi:hypothetical protein